jgi:CDGSH-type Zn-finger protein/mannose-6-phosphate isomerase-like protein (cupin superfamily)
MTDTETAHVAHRKGFYHEVKAGRRYLWCRCGRSANQPFCDGSHAGTSFQPMLFLAQKNEEVIFCGCKQSGAKPFCDGTHNNLAGGYIEDDPNSAENRAVIFASPGTGPKVALDSACFVFSTSRAKLTSCGAMAYCPVVGPADAAEFQSQFYAEIGIGVSPVVSAGGRDIVLFMVEGHGELEISGRRFAFGDRTGAYIRPTEAFRLQNRGPKQLKLFIWVAPGATELALLDTMAGAFDEKFPDRLAEIDPSQRHRMAERFFQILISSAHGSMDITQFIGNIPRSKAAPHRHLYEEALIILRGEGMVWTEHRRTGVQAGDVLFLPRKQVHSVQCTVDGGLDIVGVMSPGDNPSISY